MTATYVLNESDPEALILHCSDPRFQMAFRDFIAQELKIHHYAPLVVPGSVSAIGVQDLEPKYFETLYEQLKLLVGLNKVPRVVIINHEGCRAYEGLKGFFLARRVSITDQQQKDLLAAGRLFNDLLPESHVELYYAQLSDNKAIRFQKIL